MGLCFQCFVRHVQAAVFDRKETAVNKPLVKVFVCSLLTVILVKSLRIADGLVIAAIAMTMVRAYELMFE